MQARSASREAAKKQSPPGKPWGASDHSLVTPVTDLLCHPCDACMCIHRAMQRTAIAVLLIVALSAAGALAQTIDSPIVNDQSTEKPSPVSHVQPAMSHRCCHSAAAPRIEINLPPLPSGLPCGGQHSCCLRPAPANSPEIPTTLGQQRPGVNSAALGPNSTRVVRSRIPAMVERADFLPYVVFSTILRI